MYKIKPHLCQYCINNLFPHRLHYINTRKHGGRDIRKKYSCHQNESKHFDMLNEDNFIHNFSRTCKTYRKNVFWIKGLGILKVHSLSRYCDM